MDQEPTNAETTPADASAVAGRFVVGEIGGNTRRRRNTNSSGDATSNSQEGQPIPAGSGEAVRVSVEGQKTRRPRNAANNAVGDMVAGMAETFCVMRYGKMAQMAPQERTMIVSGISESMTSLPSHVSKQIASYSAPLMAAMGMLMYATRMSMFEAQRKANLADAHRAATASTVLRAEQIVQEHAANAPQVSPEVNRDPLNGAVKFEAPPKDQLFDVMG